MEAQNFSLEAMPPKAVRYARAKEAVETVTALWKSWDPDAILFDQHEGRYFDAGKVRQINHLGEYFQVAGPLNMPRTPQGHPVIVQSGASEEGQRLAAQTGEVVYAAVGTLADAQRFYHGVKSRLPSFGRSDSDVKIMPGLMPVIGKTKEEANEKYRQLLQMVDPAIGMALLVSLFGDLSNVDLDGPVPDRFTDRAVQSSRADLMLKVAKEKGQSLRELYQEELTNHHHNLVVGTPVEIADLMEEWFVERGADGFNLIPPYATTDLIDFVDLVMPELRRRDLVRSRYEGTTLRDNLELPYPR